MHSKSYYVCTNGVAMADTEEGRITIKKKIKWQIIFNI